MNFGAKMQNRCRAYAYTRIFENSGWKSDGTCKFPKNGNNLLSLSGKWKYKKFQKYRVPFNLSVPVLDRAKFQPFRSKLQSGPSSIVSYCDFSTNQLFCIFWLCVVLR